jgi:hypothetical protein|tara:strand:+ start:556 stop:660 length:105 start_codon:yes stop_codon:yes gene_type:complete
VGRVVNRFASDLADVDDHLANAVNIFLQVRRRGG